MSFLIPVLTFFFVLAVTLVKPKYKGSAAISGIIISSIVSSWLSIQVLAGEAYYHTLKGGAVFGNITLQIDGLSAWFILLTNFTAITAILYGRQYLKHYNTSPANLSLHYNSYLLNHFALTGIYFIQNTLAFLCFWEIIALSAFMMVIFEHGRMETLKAGVNYLIQSHVSILFLTLGFILVYAGTGSFELSAIHDYCIYSGKETGFLLFLIFFIGFGIKAGFVPFHTWLPHAHPAAPSHVSGMMSGILIKTGIYGILRILLLIPENHLAVGYMILLISLITGIYGVLLATVQHNIKKLLAYHSVENIGIIGIGIGIGAIGNGLHMPFLSYAGYAGALLHTLNHSLFKSLLFYNTGTIYIANHTHYIDQMGGLIKKIPQTAMLFLLSALAICGLPPFNGFVSEFLIYTGLFNAISSGHSASVIVLAIIGLSFIGGLALMCFTKAFGIMFLGSARKPDHTVIPVENTQILIPKYLIAITILAIGLFPQVWIKILQEPVGLFTGIAAPPEYLNLTTLMQNISIGVTGMILFIIILFLIRRKVTQRYASETRPTWNCGYNSASPRLQYTASSFVRTYARIIKPLIITTKANDEIKEIIPEPLHIETHFYDKMEKGLVDWPIRNLKGFLGRFKFLQNGSVQFYVLYGVVFIGIGITIPLIIKAVQYIIQLFN
jgi:hydrogenase-4 component B